MPNLFPNGYEDEVIAEEEIADKREEGYKPSVYFDGVDMVRDGQNRIIKATGIEAWEQWCIKCISTERYKHPAYLTDYGIEREEALKAETRGMAESILTREINEALLADPYGRTKYIEDIIYTWDTDSVVIYVSVVGVDDVTIDFTVQLGGFSGGV